jgi:hypothetical protein
MLLNKPLIVQFAGQSIQMKWIDARPELGVDGANAETA